MILFTGTQSLIAAAMTAVSTLVAALGGYKGVCAAIAWQAADPEEKPRKKKDVIWTVVITVIGVCIPQLLNWVLGFYGG